MAAERIAEAIAVSRVAFGGLLCGRPEVAASWVGDDARTPGAGMIIRILAAREVALGLGTLASRREPVERRRWLLASGACDAADFAVTLASQRAGSARNVVLASAAAAALVNLGAALAVASRSR
jgi:hypothetical protein